MSDIYACLPLRTPSSLMPKLTSVSLPSFKTTSDTTSSQVLSSSLEASGKKAKSKGYFYYLVHHKRFKEAIRRGTLKKTESSAFILFTAVLTRFLARFSYSTKKSYIKKHLCRCLDEIANLGKAGDYRLGIFNCIYEITEALSFMKMNESAYRVETTSRLVQWRIDHLASCTFRKSDPFEMGKWNWFLSIEKNRGLIIKLYPEISNLTKDNPPIASFFIRVVCSAGDRKTISHPEVIDKPLGTNEDFVWTVEVPPTGKFIIEVEFLDLKITKNTGEDPCSIWSQGLKQKQTNSTALEVLHKMLTESIHTDITLNVTDGKLGAHRAVLVARSPVFRSMFTHDLKEKELSTVDIPDMSVLSCKAFLNYIYGSIEHEEFITHRLALLIAADKYGLFDLKEACLESLMEDIDTKNVLERLQFSYLYQLPKLKASCMCYLIKFGKIFDIRDDLNGFIQFAHRDLIAEIFQEILGYWKGF